MEAVKISKRSGRVIKRLSRLVPFQLWIFANVMVLSMCHQSRQLSAVIKDGFSALDRMQDWFILIEAVDVKRVS